VKLTVHVLVYSQINLRARQILLLDETNFHRVLEGLLAWVPHNVIFLYGLYTDFSCLYERPVADPEIG